MVADCLALGRGSLEQEQASHIVMDIGFSNVHFVHDHSAGTEYFRWPFVRTAGRRTSFVVELLRLDPLFERSLSSCSAWAAGSFASASKRFLGFLRKLRGGSSKTIGRSRSSVLVKLPFVLDIRALYANCVLFAGSVATLS